MKPSVKLEEHLDDVAFVAWRGLKIEVWHLYDQLTGLGWKVDTQESDLMIGMSKTWRAEGIKVWIRLQAFVCAPPTDEVERPDQIGFYRFDPAAMPTKTMHEQIYAPGAEGEDWYPTHRADWAWLVEHGDPQSDTWELLTPIALREVPTALLEEAWMEIEEGVELAEAEE